MLEEYVLMIEFVIVLSIVYGVSSYIGDKIAQRDRIKQLEGKPWLKLED